MSFDDANFPFCTGSQTRIFLLSSRIGGEATTIDRVTMNHMPHGHPDILVAEAIKYKY